MIGLVLVTYAHWPEKLIASVETSGIQVTWYIHHHGADPDFAERIEALSARTNFKIYMHRVNRGLSRSWNEGLHQAYEDGVEHALLVNDDLHFVGDGFSQFLDYARSQTDYGLAFLHGLETGASHHSGQIIAQGFACCIVTPIALDKVGWFDENIAPAYYEDLDYFRRCHLSGVKIVTAADVLVEHERSKTTRENPEIAAQAGAVMQRNRDYYTKKWGPPRTENYKIPFGDPILTNKIEWNARSDPYPGRAP